MISRAGGQRKLDPSHQVAEVKMTSSRVLRFNSWACSCSICCEEVAVDGAATLACGHGWYCPGCMTRYVEARLSEGLAGEMPCPECSCGISEEELVRARAVGERPRGAEASFRRPPSSAYTPPTSTGKRWPQALCPDPARRPTALCTRPLRSKTLPGRPAHFVARSPAAGAVESFCSLIGSSEPQRLYSI